jgi:hypothetical protein
LNYGGAATSERLCTQDHVIFTWHSRGHSNTRCHPCPEREAAKPTEEDEANDYPVSLSSVLYVNSKKISSRQLPETMRLSLNGDNVEIELDVMVSIAQIQGKCEAKYKVVRRSVDVRTSTGRGRVQAHDMAGFSLSNVMSRRRCIRHEREMNTHQIQIDDGYVQLP